MYNNYFNIDQLKKEDYKIKHKFESNKHYLYELYSATEQKTLNLKIPDIKHDVMSYDGLIGKYVTNFETLKAFAVEYSNTKSNDKQFCFVENKTKFYKLNFDFDFKIEKYKTLFGDKFDHEKVTNYIIKHTINVINEVYNNPNIEYIYANKKNSLGVHLYFYNIITDKETHQYIFDRVNSIIENENIYSKELIKNIFDACVSKANGLRLFYYKSNGDYYYPNPDKSTMKFSSKIDKHFHLCILNTNYDVYNLNLKIDKNIIYNNTFVIDTKQKEKDIVDKIIKKDIEYVNDIKTLGNEDKKQMFLQLCDILNVDRNSNYHSWISIIYLFKTYGLLDECIEFSKNCIEKFNDDSITIIKHIFNDDKKCKKPITIGTLIYWAYKDNYNKACSIIKRYHLTFKLSIDNISEILLCNKEFKVDYSENSKHISPEAIEIFKQQILQNVQINILIHSGTGTGKTTSCKDIMNFVEKNFSSSNVLTVVTRRSMSSCHIASFGKKFVSYLDKTPKKNMSHYISSLEHLSKLESDRDFNCFHENYDVLIIDEVNSLMNYLYSSTLKDIRLPCIQALIKLIKNAKVIISLDGMISDMVHTFFKQIGVKSFCYKNTYQNKIGVKMNIVYCNKNDNSENNNITTFLKDAIEKYIKPGKSILFLTDSKKISDKIYSYCKKFNDKEDYYRVFNSDQGTIDDITNIDTIGINRCIIASPKIEYGVDITIKYDEIFVIYKHSDGLKSMSALGMFQQISRARDTKQVNLLVLNKFCQYNFNEAISFEDCKKIQDIGTNDHIKNSSYLDKSGNIVTNTNDFFAELDYYKKFYDYTFSRNKIDILMIVAKGYGYDIIESPLKCVYSTNTIKTDVKLLKHETDEISKLIFDGKEIDEKYIHFIESTTEQVNIRKNYINKHTTMDIDSVRKLACDKILFNNWLNKIILDYDITKFNEHKFIYFKNEYPQIAKDNVIYNQIDTMFFLEEYFKISRYKINDMVNLDLLQVKKFLLDNIDKLFFIFKNNEWKNKTINSIKKKINGLNSTNHVQKLIADCYNHVSDGSISVKNKRVKKDNMQFVFYIFN